MTTMTTTARPGALARRMARVLAVEQPDEPEQPTPAPAAAPSPAAQPAPVQAEPEDTDDQAEVDEPAVEPGTPAQAADAVARLLAARRRQPKARSRRGALAARVRAMVAAGAHLA